MDHPVVPTVGAESSSHPTIAVPLAGQNSPFVPDPSPPSFVSTPFQPQWALNAGTINLDGTFQRPGRSSAVTIINPDTGAPVTLAKPKSISIKKPDGNPATFPELDSKGKNAVEKPCLSASVFASTSSADAQHVQASAGNGWTVPVAAKQPLSPEEREKHEQRKNPRDAIWSIRAGRDIRATQLQGRHMPKAYQHNLLAWQAPFQGRHSLAHLAFMNYWRFCMCDLLDWLCCCLDARYKERGYQTFEYEHAAWPIPKKKPTMSLAEKKAQILKEDAMTDEERAMARAAANMNEPTENEIRRVSNDEVVANMRWLPEDEAEDQSEPHSSAENTDLKQELVGDRRREPPKIWERRIVMIQRARNMNFTDEMQDLARDFDTIENCRRLLLETDSKGDCLTLHEECERQSHYDRDHTKPKTIEDCAPFAVPIKEWMCFQPEKAVPRIDELMDIVKRQLLTPNGEPAWKMEYAKLPSLISLCNMWHGSRNFDFKFSTNAYASEMMRWNDLLNPLVKFQTGCTSFPINYYETMRDVTPDTYSESSSTSGVSFQTSIESALESSGNQQKPPGFPPMVTYQPAPEGHPLEEIKLAGAQARIIGSQPGQQRPLDGEQKKPTQEEIVAEWPDEFHFTCHGENVQIKTVCWNPKCLKYGIKRPTPNVQRLRPAQLGSVPQFPPAIPTIASTS